jgi:hypothetical protein
MNAVTITLRAPIPRDRGILSNYGSYISGEFTWSMRVPEYMVTVAQKQTLPPVSVPNI